MPGSPEAPSPAGAPTPFPAPAEVELRLALVRQRYGDRLTAEQLDEMRQALAVQVDNAAALRAVPLANGDAPYPPFAAYRSDAG